MMKTIHFTGILLLLIFLFSGCKTAQKAQSGPLVPETVAPPAGEIRGVTLMPGSILNVDPEIMKQNLISFIRKSAERNYNTVFFFASGNSDPLQPATEEAHKNGMKIYAVINFPVSSDKGREIPLSLRKTMLRDEVRNLAENFNIDGLGIQISDHPRELIESMVVESMLIKPYLVNFLVWSGEDEFNNADSYRNEGIVDMIMSKDEIINNENVAYKDRIQVPSDLKKIRPEQVIGLDFSAIFSVNAGGQAVKFNGSDRSAVTDSEGFLGLITSRTDTLRIESTAGSYVFPMSGWSLPYKYAIQPDGKVIRKSPWVEFRRMPREMTNIPEFELLCKSEYPSTVMINGIPVKQYKTGIFFNKITLNEGKNRVRASVVTSDSLSVFYEREFTYIKSDISRNPLPLWIDDRSIEPSGEMEMLSDDVIRISFQGSRGQDAFVKIVPGKSRIKCEREDFTDYSVYRANLYLDKIAKGKTSGIIIELIGSGGTGKLSYKLPGSLSVRNLESFPVVRVKNENSRLTYNLGAPRLGGPIRSELGSGVLLKTNGKTGSYYRVRLSNIENGYVHSDDVELMPEEKVQPSYIITSMSCGPSEGADQLTIPYPEPVPYEIFPDPAGKRIVIKLFGVQTASTWITHLNSRRIIDNVTWQQTTPETYQIYVNLKSSVIWGYDLYPSGKRLVFRVKYPPVFNPDSSSPLSGLKIAIEAGHGGSGIGAVGLSGLEEKVINLDLSFRLGELCKQMGAEVIQVRDTDKDMALLEKRDIAIKSGADMLISIHANAGGRGYLSVAGTSTYWNNPLWAPLAEDIYGRLLELDLKEFGVVGSFNYTVTRATQMPSVLVEQAFMSHAEDEEKLSDPQFRQEMAAKILKGIVDYLKSVK